MVCFAFFFKKIDVSDLVVHWKDFDILVYLKGLGFYFMANLLKAGRFAAFGRCFNSVFRFLKLCMVTSAYNLFTTIIPVGIGEVSLPILMKRYFRYGLKESTSELALVRFYDVLVLFIFLAIGIVFVQSGEHHMVMSGFLAVGAVMAVVFFQIEAFFRFMGWCLHSLSGIVKSLFFERLAESVTTVFALIVKKRGEKRNIIVLIASFMMWFMIALGVTHSLFRSFGVDFGLVEVMFVCSLMNLLNILPVNTFGGFGVKEAGISVILLFLGFSSQDAISLGILGRFLALSYACVLPVLTAGALGGYLLYRRFFMTIR